MPSRKEYQANKEHWREYNREYQREWRKTHAEQKAAYDKKSKEKMLQSPELRMRYKVKHDLNQAVRRGKLIKPTVCPNCGKSARIDGHHFDYSKPLEVVWLCRPCHVAVHHPFI